MGLLWGVLTQTGLDSGVIRRDWAWSAEHSHLNASAGSGGETGGHRGVAEQGPGWRVAAAGDSN